MTREESASGWAADSALLKTSTLSRSWLVTLVLACSGLRGAMAQDVAVHDSAGVIIVVNRRPLWTHGSGWVIDPGPMVDIGDNEDVPGAALYRVRGAIRVGDGRIVVADERQRLLFFDDRGRFLHATGRRGGGPGEFEALALLGRYRGDSVYTVDVARDAFSVFDSEGRFGRSEPLISRGVGVGYQPRGTLGDGAMILTSGTLPLGGVPLREFLWSYLIVTDDRLVPVDTLGMFPKTVAGNANGSLYFAPFAETVVCRTMICTGFSNEIAIQFVRPDGEVARIAQVPFEPFRITGRRWDAFVKWQLARFEQPRYPPSVKERARREMDRNEHAEQLPAFARMLSDPLGNIWLQEYPFAGMRDPRWQVVRPDGRWLGAVAFPGAFEPYEIGMEYILGVWRDDLGVEHVRQYRLRREAR